MGRRLRYGFVARRHFAGRAGWYEPQPVRGHVGLTDALRVLEHRVYRVESQVIR